MGVSRRFLHPRQASLFLHRRLTAEFFGLLVSLIPCIWCFGRALLSSSSRKRRLFHRYDQKSNGSRVHDFKEKRISTYRTTSRRIGGRCLVRAAWVFSNLLGDYMGDYLSGVGRAAKTIVRALLLDISERKLVFPGRFWGWGRMRSWVDIFPFSSHVQSSIWLRLYHGLMVGKPRMGRPSLYPFLFFFFSFSCLDFLELHIGYGYRREGETFAFLACLGPWVVWRLHLLHTYSELGSLGLVQHSGLGSGRACEALC
ncbi:hypothetical protein VTG60DRAFT_4327 [Thermothelomyces hinnuleus]